MYRAAVDFFDLRVSEYSTVNLVDGAEYVRNLANLSRSDQLEELKWSYVIQDCFTGGAVPVDLFTLDFWLDVADIVENDGIVAIVC